MGNTIEQSHTEYGFVGILSTHLPSVRASAAPSAPRGGAGAPPPHGRYCGSCSMTSKWTVYAVAGARSVKTCSMASPAHDT
jgi:hypothetical protein